MAAGKSRRNPGTVSHAPLQEIGSPHDAIATSPSIRLSRDFLPGKPGRRDWRGQLYYLIYDVSEPGRPTHAGPAGIAKTNSPNQCRFPARRTIRRRIWWSRSESNRRPPACKAGALPTELRPRRVRSTRAMVGPGRFELPTSRLSGVRSNQLSYGPRKTPTGGCRQADAGRQSRRRRQTRGPAASQPAPRRESFADGARKGWPAKPGNGGKGYGDGGPPAPGGL